MLPPISQILSPAHVSQTPFPEDVTVNILSNCDGPTLDNVLTAAKCFKQPVGKARENILRLLFKQQGRRTDEKIPTRLELAAMGYFNPDMARIIKLVDGISAVHETAAIAATPSPRHQLVESGLFRKNAESLARLQFMIRNKPRIKEYYENNPADHYIVEHRNASGQSHGFGIRNETFVFEHDTLFTRHFAGNFVNGKRHGLGYEIMPSGYRYEGMYKNDEYDGQGTLMSSCSARYDGLFQNGKFHGLGKLTYANGCYFEGLFENGQKNGHGVETFSNGSKYVGEFTKGELTGQGKLTYLSGANYEGGFVKGVPDNFGVVTSPDNGARSL